MLTIGHVGPHNYDQAVQRLALQDDLDEAPAYHPIEHDRMLTEAASIGSAQYLRGQPNESEPGWHERDGQRYRLIDHGTGRVSAGVKHPGEDSYGQVGYLSHFDDGEIKSTWVHPAHRRRGVATALLDYARQRHPDLDIRHSTNQTEDAKAWSAHSAAGPLHSEAARFTPERRIFTHTCGLDHRLFDEHQKLRPEVRRYVMGTIGHFFSGRYPEWSHWVRIYFAGSEASEWTGESLEGNNDFDVLLGIDYDAFRAATGSQLDNAGVTAQLNAELHADVATWGGNVWITIDGVRTGPWDRTTYINADSWDIRRIKPYAAYDVGENSWVVKPPHLPHWALSDFPKPVVATLRAAESYAKAVLKLPEPERTQQGAALFTAWHEDRSRAFSERGEGWYDIANLREKWLDQEGLWAELVQCAHNARQGFDLAPGDWSNTPPGYVAARVASLYHGTSIESAHDIINNGARPGLNLAKRKKDADGYAEIGENWHGGGVTIEGDLVGEGHHQEPWGYVTAHPDGFRPRRLHYPDGRVEEIGEHTASLPKTQKCKYCEQQATQRVIHSEGMAYIPACPDHLDKAKADAAKSVPYGDPDPGNIDAIRPVAAVEGHLPPGYDMRVQEVEETERWGLPKTQINIHHEGKPRPVASLSVHQRIDPDTGSLVGHPNIGVDPAHQRKGLATAMYAEMHRRWPELPIKHSEHRSDDARALDPTLKERFGPDLHYGSATTDALDEVGHREHPNVEHYQSGGMGHLDGDEAHSVVGFMPTQFMKRYREHAGDWNGQHSEERVHAIREDIRNGVGIHTPLTVHYDDKAQWGYVGEGNHRLRAADEEGTKTVPVRVVRNNSGSVADRKKQGVGAAMNLERRFAPHEPSYVPTDIHPYHFMHEGNRAGSLGTISAMTVEATRTIMVTPMLLMGEVPSGLQHWKRVNSPAEVLAATEAGFTAVVPADAWVTVLDVLLNWGVSRRDAEDRLKLLRAS